MTDEEALSLAIKGRTEGFRTIYLRYGGYLYNLALRMLRNRESAEDAVQEAFTSAFRSISDFQGKSRLKTWLYTILYRAALKIQEKRKNEMPVEILRTEMPCVGQMNAETRVDVKKILDKLDSRDREVLTLAYWDDLSCREIGEIMQLNENHVKVLLFRARERFNRLWLAQENRNRQVGRGNL